MLFRCILCAATLAISPTLLHAAGGSLTVSAEDEATQQPAITRFEVWRGGPGGKKVPIRRTVPAGIGVVLDRNVVLMLADSDYTFRMIRGPEYRIIAGNFTLEDTSLDDRVVRLPRMVDMLAKGWTSGDCCVVASPNSLPLRMASEDLHVAAVLGHEDAKPIANRDRDDPIDFAPSWISEEAVHRDGLVFYGTQSTATDAPDLLAVERIAKLIQSDASTKIAIENPFAWELPVWLASEHIDGVFVLGGWLRLDRKVLKVNDGRPPEKPGFADGKSVGRWGEEIYRRMLDAGLRVPPLAGGGSGSANTPVGYNRLYVGLQPDDQDNDGLQVRKVTSQQDWWNAAWRGHSIATNGPMLRPKLDGRIPGHIFHASSGESVKLQPEIALSVRDKVEYLEVIKNGTVHYSARLDEFARAGGRIPPMEITESSWVIMRVVTQFEDHYRAAITAPWYVDFDGRRRVGRKAVEFFQRWLVEYEKRLKRLPPEELRRHVPFVRAARKFWANKAQIAVP